MITLHKSNASLKTTLALESSEFYFIFFTFWWNCEINSLKQNKSRQIIEFEGILNKKLWYYISIYIPRLTLRVFLFIFYEGLNPTKDDGP